MGTDHPATSYKRRLTLLGLILLIAIIFWYSPTLKDYFFVLVDYFEKVAGQNKIWGAILFIILATLSSMLSLFSSVPLVPISVIVFGNFPSLAFLMAGWVIGGAISYFIGKYASYLINHEYLNRVEQVKENFSKRTQFGIVVLLRLALPTELTGYALGVIKYNFTRYLLATFIAELPFAIAAIYLSDELIKENISSFILTLVAMAIAVYLFSRWVRRTIKVKGAGL